MLFNYFPAFLFYLLTFLSISSSDGELIQEISSQSTAPGHEHVRTLLGDDIGEMNFHSQKANEFRTYLYNSLLSSSNSKNYDGSYSSSSTDIVMCSDGSFLQSNFGLVSIDVPGASASSRGTDYMPGYWDVASLPNGLLIIIFYSNHEDMLVDSPTGILPFPVLQYTDEYVIMPNGDGYARSLTQDCDY